MTASARGRARRPRHAGARRPRPRAARRRGRGPHPRAGRAHGALHARRRAHRVLRRAPGPGRHQGAPGHPRREGRARHREGRRRQRRGAPRGHARAARRRWSSRASRASGIVFARASNHFGPVAPYSLIAAEAGFASIIGSNASTTIAPWGGRDARLGNSPVGFCVPNPGGQPILLDMALSVVARAKIRNAAKRGEAIPPTWATDKDGKPTTDPNAALDGFLLPIGGPQGLRPRAHRRPLRGPALGRGVPHARELVVRQPGGAVRPGPLLLPHRHGAPGPARAGWPRACRTSLAILHDTPPADPAAPVLLPAKSSSASSSAIAATASPSTPPSSPGSNPSPPAPAPAPDSHHFTVPASSGDILR